MDGTPCPAPTVRSPSEPFVYHGFYRHGKRVVFAYRDRRRGVLDAPWVEDGKFTRTVAPATEHPLAGLTRGRPGAVAPGARRRAARSARQRPYAIDTIEPPFENPWNALLFFGDHDFLPDGSAMLCTMQGDVWHVDGLDDTLAQRALAAVRLGPAPGAGTGRRRRQGLRPGSRPDHAAARPQRRRRGRLLRVRQQRLRDLARRPRFHLRTPARRRRAILHGLGQAGPAPDLARRRAGRGGGHRLSQCGRSGTHIRRRAHRAQFGRRMGTGLDGLRGQAGRPLRLSRTRGTASRPTCRSSTCPRGLDNSSGGAGGGHQRPLGAAEGPAAPLLVRRGDAFPAAPRTSGRPAPGGRRAPAGRLPLGRPPRPVQPQGRPALRVGMAGWGTYTSHDGCFQRVRYTGDPVQLPVAFHAHENGVLSHSPGRSIERRRAARQPVRPGLELPLQRRLRLARALAAASGRSRARPGRDPLGARPGRRADASSSRCPSSSRSTSSTFTCGSTKAAPQDLFATVHKLAAPFTGFPGYRPASKTIAAHPILADMAASRR